MTGAEPPIALVILVRRLGRQVRRQKNASGSRIADKAVERGFDVALAAVRPDGSGQKEIELGAEDRRIEVGVEIEMGPLQLDLFGRKKIVEPVVDALARGLDAKVAAGIEESDEPVCDPEASAADVEDLGFGSQSRLEQGNHLFAAGLFERLDGNAQESVP